MDDALAAPISLAALLLAALSLLLIVWALRRRRSVIDTGTRPWEAQLRSVCEQARAVVDELLPRRGAEELPSTATLTGAMTRLRQLDDRLARIVRDAPPRASEAAEDIGRVSVSLRSALQAERVGRMAVEPGERSRRKASVRLVVERTAELEMAVQAAVWLLDDR